MYRHSIKPVLIGVLAGLILFALPFLIFRLLFLVLVVGGIFRLVSGRRFSRRHARIRPELHPVFADTIRHMSDDEYKSFRQSLSGDYHHRLTIPITEVKEA